MNPDPHESMNKRLVFPALLLIAAVAGYLLFGTDPVDEPLPSTTRSEETKDAEARTAQNEVPEPAPPTGLIPPLGDRARGIPESDWIPIEALPEAIAPRVSSILREVRAAYIRTGKRLPDVDPFTTPELAAEVLRLHAEWIQSRGDLRTRYREAFEQARARAPLENHGVYESIDEFESLMRDRFGSDFDRRRGHLHTRPSGSAYEWFYFPPGADPELDRLKAGLRTDVEFQVTELYEPLSGLFRWR